MKKLIIDYVEETLYDWGSGSVFYFETLEEVFDFIRTAAKNSYHTYYIEDLKENEDNENGVE